MKTVNDLKTHLLSYRDCSILILVFVQFHLCWIRWYEDVT